MKPNIYTLTAILLLSIAMGCKKFLDEKPDQKLSTIQTLGDMQALLDNYPHMNQSDPSMGESCADNYFITDAVYNARNEYDRNLYTWAPERVSAPAANAWRDAFTQVNIANNVLKAVEERGPTITDKQKLANIKAQALFFRGKSFLNVVGIWAMPYDPSTAGILPGIPLRTDPDFNVPSVRANLSESYARIIADLQESIAGLPLKDIIQTRPSKAAAYGMLSRTYLQMREYVKAGNYADSCIQINNVLLDYNSLNATANFPFVAFNSEVSYEGMANPGGLIPQSRAMVSMELYSLYGPNDLRKALFFKVSGTGYLFKGSYEGTGNYFNGISTNEVLLTRSECRIRNGDIGKGLDDLNQLLRYRYKTGTFTPYANLSREQALILIKTERRKELAFRCLRWADIRRYNQEGDNIVLKRSVNGKEYLLQPNSLLYALAIPEDVIKLSGMEQNAR
ncbi:RagB/SusD family nutrient uptake outer membrane protein [Pedobacter sp. ISL-68]|uniref:RagB/SusD family nutrient uptake outer membrane protein n=1 Tax=unclassified Pedobacter TaxID=2628915 RepID=UPI001BE8ED05|nr:MULTISPECIES: RagB/SusD family nutrient uptake outer membrane protein [unclassified Pedobacter]MBT2563754.1 RagB/SusD family nutrient uptake outer membrane protein [Pedobacter sp. ISL-64]MBT2589646.1 RagB/SusD family nutrient uptake outer membrane protein [Pedobacter sp. ISL-68]